jgi:LuxR family maltose regulon positive regulatory protein
MRSGRSATVQRWLRRFPDPELDESPQLGYVGAFVAALAGGTETEVDHWLRVAERTAAAHPSGPMPDGTTSYDVNVDMIRAGFVYRDVRAAVAIAQRVVAAEDGGGQWRVPAYGGLAFLRYLLGQPEAARAAASEALGDRDAPRRPHGVIWALSTLSLLDLDDGDPEKAGRTTQRALDLAASVGLDNSVTAGLAYVGRGRGLVELGRPEEGVSALEAATGRLEGRAPIAHHAYALLALAEGQRAAGDLIASHRSADAAELLIDSFDDAGILPGMLAALRDRSQLTRRRRPAAPGAELSESELSVLRLLAGPLSRREIATELLVSPNTVKTHVSSIYRKLDVGSRADAVVRAGELELL